jgi:hypothetical protein
MIKLKDILQENQFSLNEEEGASIHPEILKNKTLIKANISVRLEKIFRKLINDELAAADGEKGFSLLSRIFPIDDVIDKVVEVYVKYVPRIIDSGFFECEVDEGAISKLLRKFLIELGGIIYYFIDDIGSIKTKLLSTYISTTGINLEKGMKQNEDDVKRKMSKIIDKMFFQRPYNYFHVALKDTIKPYKGTGCNMTKNKKGWWGTYATMNDINFFPKVHTKIIDKLS